MKVLIIRILISYKCVYGPDGTKQVWTIYFIKISENNDFEHGKKLLEALMTHDVGVVVLS